MIELVIEGNIPSKKNLLRFRAGRSKPFYDTDVRMALDDICDQVADQWAARAPLLHPARMIVFYGMSELSDRDNKFTTLLDALVGGGVLKNDDIASCNGEMLIGCAYKGEESSSGARVFVEPSGNLSVLHRKVNELEDLTKYKVVRPAGKAKGFRKR